MATKKDQEQKKGQSKKPTPSAKKGAAVSKKRPAARTAKSAADELPKRAPSPFVVKGQILTAEGKPASGLRVAAYDRDVDGETWLGEVVTGSDGRYSINFDEKRFRRTSLESGGPDLFVCVFNNKGEQLYQSATIYNVRQEQHVDVKLPSSNNQVTNTLDYEYVVFCKVEDRIGSPVEGIRIQAYDQDPISVHDKLGVPVVAGRDGIAEIHFRKSEFTEHPGEQEPDLYFCLYRGPVKLDHKLVNEHDDHGVLRKFKPRREPIKIQVEKHQVLEGFLLTEYGEPARGVQLRLYNQEFGDKPISLGKAISDQNGFYAFIFSTDNKVANLKVSAADGKKKDGTSKEEEEVSLSDTKFAANTYEIMNLVVPAKLKPLDSEYQRLTKDINDYFGAKPGGNDPLAGAKETEGRRDLSVLNRATGWDARLIALAAKASKLSAELSDVNLSSEALYGLFRAGLPTDKRLLARVSPETVEKALNRVNEKDSQAGIIKLTDEQIKSIREEFNGFAINTRRNMPAPGSRSTYDELIENIGWSTQDANQFRNIYLQHQGNAAELLEKIQKEDQLKQYIPKLQFHGKLNFLTLNNAQLTKNVAELKLPEQNDVISDPAQLVELDYYRADEWKKLIYSVANIPRDVKQELRENEKVALGSLIPPAYTAEKIEDRLNSYTEDMARKIRLSYPTYVITRMIENNELLLDEEEKSVAPILKDAAVRGFKLGQTPVDTFFTDKKVEVLEPHGKTLKKLYRASQLTPSNESMKVLLESGLTSAYDITAFSRDVFLERYGPKFPTRVEAEQVYRKAEQINAVALNIFGMANEFASLTPMYALSGSMDQREAATKELIKRYPSLIPGYALSGSMDQREAATKEPIKRYPSLESLFGSLDFCECEHCQSVLSPAAYFVDLLQFLDPDSSDRNSSLTDREMKYNQEKYTDKYLKPYDALIQRRPDLPYIQLTCENTNTAMPYIDVVNEILEYFVAYNGLSPEAYDTGVATTSELLAEPQNILDNAYETVAKAHYPLTLPFDLWLETTRRFSDYFKTPFSQILECFRPTDELFLPRPAIENPTNHELAVVFVPYANAITFKIGDAVTYYDISAKSIHTLTKYIQSISSPSPSGKRLTRITLTGIWDKPPEAGDLLVHAGRYYVWEDIFAEHLGISPIEHEIFSITGLSSNCPADLFGYTGGFHSATIKKSAFPIYEGFFVDVLNYDALKFGVGDEVIYYDQSKQEFCEKTNNILEIGAPDSGTEKGTTRIKLSPAWLPIPKSGDLLVCTTLAELRSAKLLSRRLGVTYKELAEVIQTGFVNPRLCEMVILYKLGVSIRDVCFYFNYKGLLNQSPDTLIQADQVRRLIVEAFADKLNQKAETFKKTTVQLESELQSIRFSEILVLADPDAGCNFDMTTLQYADGMTNAKPIDFLRINLFVRLWRKLGWSSEETDQALCTFIPHNAPFDEENLAKQPFRTALVYLAHLKTLDEKLNLGKNSRLKLLTLWSPMATTGKNPLYAQLFLNRSILKSDPVFDDPFGQYLSPELDLKVKDHLPALQSALALTSNEIETILKDNEQELADGSLTVETISLLYRYSLLAKALKLSIRELITLKQLSGLDPFTPLDPDPITNLEQDGPYQTLKFVEVAEQVRESGFKLEDLDYLFRHQFDEMGKYRPNNEETLALMKCLSDSIQAIRAEHAIPGDPAAMSDEVLRQKLSLALQSDVVERFLSMMNGTAEFIAIRSIKSPDESPLSPEDYASEPAIVKVDYDQTRQEQMLTFRGVLCDSQKISLKGKYPSQVFADLLDDVQEQARRFFFDYIVKSPANMAPVSGFLVGDTYIFDTMFSPNSILSPEQQQDRLRLRRTKLVQGLMLYLQQRMIHQFVVQTMTARTGAEQSVVECLLTDKELLGDSQPLLEALSEAAACGITATFFSTPDCSDPALKTLTLPDADMGKEKVNSARFEGYLEVPLPGAYRFYVKLPKGHVGVPPEEELTVELNFEHLPKPWLKVTAGTDEYEDSKYLELKSGVLYRFTLEFRNLKEENAQVHVQVQGESLPKGKLSQLRLYPLSSILGAERAWILLNKALQILQNFAFSEREMRYWLKNGINLSILPVTNNNGSPDNANKLFVQFLRLVIYARLKRDLAGSTDDLIGIFQTEKLDEVYSLIAKITRRDEATVREATKVLFPDPDFSNEQALQRLWEALQLIERWGVPAATIAGWTRIVSATAKPNERSKIARDLKDAVKARFEPEAWQRIAQPIFDKLRQRQRDALAAYVMHQHGFDRIEQLFEYFLIDPGMEPVVQTSRIRLAISSVQLFIQRCLLNLEKEVPPSAINTKQWEWMKRYRVWEANRKIFLYPENWLEPEFRDDKTHLFTELEGNLLQGDVSADLVEDAFLNYLTKLEEIARLDIVGLYYDHNTDTLHVIGRTYNTPQKYFYRRYAQSMWTPWEPVTADIQGDTLAPVVWNDRLHLFWVTFLEKADSAIPNQSDQKLPEPTLSETKPSDVVKPVNKEIEAELHWSELNNGQWSATKSAGFNLPEDKKLKAKLGAIEGYFDGKTIEMYISNEPYDETTEELDDETNNGLGIKVNFYGKLFDKAFYLVSGNNSPALRNPDPLPRVKSYQIYKITQTRDIFLGVNLPQLRYLEDGTQEVGIALFRILNYLSEFQIVQDRSIAAFSSSGQEVDPLIASFERPFFLQSENEVLFVEPNLTVNKVEDFTWMVAKPDEPPFKWEKPDTGTKPYPNNGGVQGPTIYPKEDLSVTPQIPEYELPSDYRPDLFEKFKDFDGVYKFKSGPDWLVNGHTAMVFDGIFIGPKGDICLDVCSLSETGGAILEGSIAVNVNVTSGLTSDSVVVATHPDWLEQSGLAQSTGELNVVGGAGATPSPSKQTHGVSRTGLDKQANRNKIFRQ
ncbi:MAG: hypothetical protein JST85_15710 [Acidobacteria bacterium]|nr:hypothetical protein [Acidobacteriota bacterium]